MAAPAPQGRAGARMARVFTVDVQATESFFRVDTRSVTGLTLGVGGVYPGETLRPSLRVFATHQHEEGLVSVLDHPWGALFGIGAGIRHRAGGGATVGLEMPLGRGRFGEYFVSGTSSATWFPDTSLGPQIYGAASVGLGLNYWLEFK